MKRVCAWCEKDLGPSADPPATEVHPITHGICGDCARETLRVNATPLRSFLDRFSQPVFLVNAGGRVVTGNHRALALLNKPVEEVEGRLGGEVFECVYADQPGGCGETVHCRTCAIRLAVVGTLESGKSKIRIPAYPDLHRMMAENRVRFLITTERVGQAVLLRIDEVSEEIAAAPEGERRLAG